LDDFPVSNVFAVLSDRLPKNINMATSTVASSSAKSWLASGHTKLNRGWMFLRHLAAFFVAAIPDLEGKDAD
jgi:hypothetical protein